MNLNHVFISFNWHIIYLVSLLTCLTITSVCRYSRPIVIDNIDVLDLPSDELVLIIGRTGLYKALLSDVFLFTAFEDRTLHYCRLVVPPSIFFPSELASTLKLLKKYPRTENSKQVANILHSAGICNESTLCYSYKTDLSVLDSLTENVSELLTSMQDSIVYWLTSGCNEIQFIIPQNDLFSHDHEIHENLVLVMCPDSSIKLIRSLRPSHRTTPSSNREKNTLFDVFSTLISNSTHQVYEIGLLAPKHIHPKWSDDHYAWIVDFEKSVTQTKDSVANVACELLDFPLWMKYSYVPEKTPSDPFWKRGIWGNFFIRIWAKINSIYLLFFSIFFSKEKEKKAMDSKFLLRLLFRCGNANIANMKQYQSKASYEADETELLPSETQWKNRSFINLSVDPIPSLLGVESTITVGTTSFLSDNCTLNVELLFSGVCPWFDFLNKEIEDPLLCVKLEE